MKQINSSFGSGGMALAMTETEFGSFLMFLKSNVPREGIPILKAAAVIGQQPCGKVWVMGKDVQVSYCFVCTCVCVCVFALACVCV